MIDFEVAKKSFADCMVEGYVFLLKEDFKTTPDMRAMQDEFYPNLVRILDRHKFTGKKGQSFVLTAERSGRLVQLLFFGLGDLECSWDRELENLRRTMGTVVHTLKKRSIKDAVVHVPSPRPFGVDKAELVKQMAVAGTFADYEFVTFKSGKKEKPYEGLVFFDVDKASRKSVVKALNEAEIIGLAANEARELIDMPPNVMTPTYLSNYAKKMAKANNLKCTVFGRDKASKLGMGGFCAVDVGSDQDGKFIVLEYNYSAKAPTIALVGKGVTFDTGGISLKPSNRMKGMKYDMSGAACVIGSIHALAQLKPKVNVVAVAPAVENMPSGKAGRQDDIITFMNGKTAEIDSTDAEGRLILADGLHYAEKNYKPDAIVDVATLTGAIVYALGHYFTGLMSHDDKLVNALQKAGKLTGDRVWPMPLDEDFKPAMASDIADLNNCASPGYGGSSITAGWFLRHFVETKNWAHLDIAGTADSVKGVSYLGKGAAGAGIRLLVEYVMSYKK